MMHREAQRIRRALSRRGLTLELCRLRDPCAIGFGHSTVRDAGGKIVLVGTLAEVERWLARTSPTGRAFTRAEAFA